MKGERPLLSQLLNKFLENMKTPLLIFTVLVLFSVVHYTAGTDLGHNFTFQVRRCTHGDENRMV